MKLYADTPVRRTRQIVADVLVVVWIVGWVWVAGVVHDGTMALAAPGRQVESSATSMADGLSEAGAFLDGVPVVGGGASAPFEKASEASHSLAESGRAQVRAVERLAFWLGFIVAAIPILIVLAFVLPFRIRFAREATAGSRFIDATEDLDLFALRALAHQPMHVLAKVLYDPAGAWRRKDAAVVTALADLELRDSGLRVPKRLLLQGDAG